MARKIATTGPVWRRIIVELLQRPPYTRYERDGRVIVHCAHCGVESTETRKPAVSDHTLDCPWAAAMAVAGRAHE